MKCIYRYSLYSLYLTLLSGTQLFWEDFSTPLPGWEMELNWQVGSTGYQDHVVGDPPPGAFFYWSPSQSNYEGSMTTPIINVGDESQVLVEFFFELDFWSAGSATNGLRIEYLSGGDWVTVLSYEISPSAGDVDLSGRYESFTADVSGDFRIRWVAYGTNSTYINSWDVDNIRVSTLPKLTYVNIESSNEDPSTAYEGSDISLKFTANAEIIPDPYVQINGTQCTVENSGGTDWVATYSVQVSDPDGPLQFTIDFTDNTGIEGKTVKESTDGSTVIVDNSDPPTFTVGAVTAAGGTVLSDIWNSTNTEIQLEVNIPEDSAVTSFSYTIGNSLLFNGINDEVIIPGVNDYQATDALTIEAWIKPNSWTDYDGILNYARDLGTLEAGFGFVYFATGWRFFLKTTTNSIDYINMAEVSTPSGQWTHLAATYDGQKVRIYRNGSAIDSTDAMGDIEWSGILSDFKLGSFTKDGSTGYFDGQIDDVRIWNIVRTGAQIKASREIIVDKNESGLVGYWQMDAGSGGAATDSTSIANHGIINGATWVVEDSPLNFQTPVYDTGVIVGSAFQLRGRVNTNNFEEFGAKDTITVDDLNAGIKTVSTISDAFESITDFAHEETVQLSAFLFDAAGNYTPGDTSITNTVIDIIANSPSPVSIYSDNTYSYLAKTGDIVTVTMAYDEDVEVPDVTFHGLNADTEMDLGGETFKALYTLSGNEPEGEIEFSMLVTDYAGNQNTYTGTTDASKVFYDRTKPSIDYAYLSTNNIWNQSWALDGDVGKIQANISEDLLSSSCTFNGNATTQNWYNAQEIDFIYTFSNSDTEGKLSFELTFIDSAGNEGDTITSSTNNTYIVFDKTAPADFTVGDVNMTGGNVVATFWNSTNTGLDVLVPIDSDSTLDSGRVQIWAKVGSNNFEMLGDSSFILSSEVGTIKTMSITGESVRAITGYRDDDSITVKAFMFDIPGNETDGAESSTKLFIDETPPLLISASYESNFSDSSLATVGHVVTLDFETDVEIQTPSATISTQIGVISDLGSNRWSASYEMQDGDTEGVIPFQIGTLTDSRGNPTEGTSSTTDGTEVTFDNTQPTLNPVTILSNNPDAEWAKIGDTVTVTFTAEETLVAQTATIVTQSAAITDLGGQVYTAKYKMTESDPEEEVVFEIIVTDQVEIDSDPVTQTNDGTTVTFDRTAPTLSTVHIESDNANNTLIAIGGDNVYLTFTPQEPLILDSIVVTIAGLPPTSLTESNGSYTATLNLIGSEPGGIMEYTIDFMDRAGNPGIQVTATTDESYVNHDIVPPEIEIVSITSNNSDSTWAKVGDSVFVTFTSSETLDNISITIAGIASSYNELSVAKYQGYHIMGDSNNEGDIPFLITYTDLGGALGPDADTTTNNTNVQFDKTVPEISLTRMATNNVYGDSLAGIGSVDTLSFTISEVHKYLSVALAGSVKTPSQDGLNFLTTHTFTALDTEGWVDFSISITDSAGNPSDTLIASQDGSRVRFDGTYPTLPIVNFFSNNSNDSSLCIPGDSLFLQYTSSETLRTATITLASNSPNESGWLNGVYYASYILTGTEDEGFIPFTIGFEDWVGNSGDTISGTTNGSSVLFDMTPPDDFTLGNVVSKSGIEAEGYWNASNQTLEIVIPVPNDQTLPGGGIQVQASFGGSYSNLADTININQSDLGIGKTISISEIDFESISEFTENGNATFQAILWDKAGNSTIGTASTSIIHIDQTLPILGIVSQRTNNAIADSLAKVGDTDTLIVSSSEGLDTIQVQIFSQDVVNFGTNRDWTFTYSFQETDNDAMVSFNIVFGDTAGNFGTDVSTTTDGSTVRFDGTKPTLTSISFSSTNVIDAGLAIPADTLYLDFISSEDLLTQEVLIAGVDADTTFENVSRTPFRSWRIMDGTEPEGYIQFEIGYSDLVGNIGDTVDETTNQTSILFDMTPPNDFEFDTVFVSGGKVIFGYWNASNDTLTLRVPIPEEDATLIGGTFQSQVRFGEGTYVDIGEEKIIIGGEGVTSQDLKITRMEFTTVAGYSENLNAQFITKAKDRAGNETVGSAYNTTFHIDEIIPSLTEVLIKSNNELDSTWAKISDVVYLNFSSSEGLSFVTPVLYSDSLTGISENGGSSWTVTKTILSNNTEGVIPFYITYNDTAGNQGDQVSSSTDGRSVIFDKTNPTITSILEGSEGLDINYYNQTDSITLYWSQFDSLAGVKDAYVGLGTDSNLTDVLDWTLSDQDSLAGLGGLSLSNDGIYFGAVFVRDSAGNHSDTLWGNSIYIDTQNPDTGSVIDAYWVMDLDYTIDSTQLSYIWSNFSDNTEIDYFEIAIGTESDTTNIMNWMRSDSTDSTTVTGLNLVQDTLYYSYIRAFDLATNKSLAVRTDGIYFDDRYPIVNEITPNVISDSAGFLSVLANDTLSIKFNRPIYVYGLSVNSNVDSNFTISHEYGDSIITVIWTDTLSSYDTLTVIVDSAVAYNTLSLTDTLHFYSKLWADLNNDYDITIEDILTFNQTWPETDLGPFRGDPPHVRPQPDGEANLTDLAAFGKMWHWKYFNLEFDTTLIAARSTDALKIIAQGSKAKFNIPKDVVMAEILIGESNLSIEKMHFVNTSGSAFMFTSSDTAHGLIQFSMADHQGFDTTLTLIIPETEQDYFQAKIQYKFMDIAGVALDDGIASIDVEILPDKFMVYNNYPNPFNPITAINYDLPEVRDVNIIIYDLLGRRIRHLDLNKVKAGRHKFVWHGTNDLGKRVSTGIYFLQITAGQDLQTQKMLLLK